MRDQFGILALGQAGGNIGKEFEDLGYTTVYVNTSKEDLSTIKGTHKIHIPGADGVAKDRKRVLQLASEHIGDIVEKITALLPQKYIICTFSASGGTGSGLSVPLMAYLAQIGRVCIPAIVLPNTEQESAKAAENSYNACVEIMNINNLGATFLLDNSRHDKFAINSRFARELDAFINLKNLSMYGNIDKAERKQVLSCPGVAVIGKSSKARSTAPEMVDSLHNGVYAEITSKTAYYLAISTSNKSLDTNSISKEFTGVYDVFSGISESSSIVFAAGMQWPQKRIVEFKNKFEETVKTINNTNAMQTFEPLEPLKGLSFTPTAIQPQAPASPRDILLGLLNN
jgi:cell division GTPase FtsZ